MTGKITGNITRNAATDRIALAAAQVQLIALNRAEAKRNPAQDIRRHMSPLSSSQGDDSGALRSMAGAW